MTTVDTPDEIQEVQDPEEIYMTTIDIYAAHNPDRTTRTEIEDSLITGDSITLTRRQYDMMASRVGMMEGDRLTARIPSIIPDYDYHRGVRTIICE